MKTIIKLPVESTTEIEVTLPAFRKDNHIDLFYAILSETMVIEVLLGRKDNTYFIANSTIQKAYARDMVEVTAKEFQDAMDMAMAIVTEQRRMVKEASL